VNWQPQSRHAVLKEPEIESDSYRMLILTGLERRPPAATTTSTSISGASAVTETD